MDPLRLPLKDRVLGPILRDAARRHGERPYLSVDGTTFSFARTDHVVRALARGLRAQGLTKGDTVALLLPNCAEFVFAWYASCLVGAIWVPVNPAFDGALLDYSLTDSGSRALIVHRSLAPALATLPAATLRQLSFVAVVGGTDGLSLPEGPGAIIDHASLLHEHGPDPEVPCSYTDVQCVMYTSGTTGRAKGVVMPNGHFFASTGVFLRALELTRDDVLFTPLPLFHGLASRLGVLPALMVGAHVHVADKFHASTFWQQVTECGATVGHTIFTIPPILKGQPPSPWDRAHRLRAMYNASHDAEFEQRFGVTLVEAYGMTETGLTIYSPPGERVPGSCGRVDGDWEGAIVDEQGLPLPDGEVGEIVLRPRLPSIMMRGYLNKPAETLQALGDLWYHTGDYAKRDADGRYWFTGRKKERIRRRGENISAWEIERAVSDHPAVRDCAAVAHPARAGEDDIRIVLSLQPDGRLEPAELIGWLHGRLPAFMVPRYVEIVDELPYTATSKVEKFRLIADGLSPGAWDREAQAGAGQGGTERG